MVAEDYWVGFSGDTIISAACPTEICCQLDDGCDYISDADDLCAENRDPNSFLCSQCKEGYSESMNSVNCTKCTRTVHWEYLVLPLVVALLFVPICLFTNREYKHFSLKRQKGGSRNVFAGPKSPNTKAIVGKAKRLKNSEAKVTLPSLANITIYHQQALSQILSTNASSLWSTAFTGIFEISILQMTGGISSSSDDGNEWCFINGLNAKYKIILDLVAPAMVCLFMVTLLILTKYVVRRPIIIRYKAVNFESVGCAVFLFIIGKVLDTLFKLIACQRVGGQSVHFYFGFEACHGRTWIISLLILAVITGAFGGVFVFGRRLTKEQRADPNHFIHKIARRFKPEYWYWEYVIFVRRLVIACLAVGGYDEKSKLLFLAVIMMFIYIQRRFHPFLSWETNEAEFVLLCCIPIVIAAQLLAEWTSAFDFVAVVLSVMVLVPIPFIGFLVHRVLIKELSPSDPDPDEMERETQIETDGTTKNINGIAGAVTAAEVSRYESVEVEMQEIDQMMDYVLMDDEPVNRNMSGSCRL